VETVVDDEVAAIALSLQERAQQVFFDVAVVMTV